MYYYKRLIIASVLMAQYAAVAQPTDTLRMSLEEAWQKAEGHSRQIDVTNKAMHIADEEVKDTRLERFPEIGVSGSAEKASNLAIYEKGIFAPVTQQHEVIHTLYKFGTDFYLNIYNGNKLNLKIAENKLLQRIAEIKHEETKSNIRYKTSALYLDLQKSLIFRDLITSDIADQEKQLKEIRALQKNGTVLKSDVLRVELDLSKRKMTLVTIENDILIATQKLNIIIGEPDNRIIRPAVFEPGTIAQDDYNKYLATALEHSFTYHISEQQTELSKTNLKKVKSNVMPKVGMYGEFYYANPQIFLFPYNPAWYSLGVTGIKVSLPLSELYHNTHKVRAAKLELEKEEMMHHDTEDKVRQQVWEAFLRYKESLVQIQVATDNVAQAEENARIIKNNYFKQTALITDLLDADVQLLRSRFELAAARILAQDKFYLLQNTIGVL
ncbi:transporter [Niastella yeongjuensis]|uniref:Transporter n=1 Tax=Niastella yeongjuensis TaxID=354355 RepID=A0A1V9F2T4_9BACT|nr:TolC family protein [Niastella yeongjuensis]OQP52654.1 transporter [Niastella yeongjuensis]SEP33023.1 Outer membrane protein TolC [Niastella yeongjuensis]